MYKFLKIISLTSIILFSSCVNDSNPEVFTVGEYKKIRNEVTEYFENEDFSCKNEADKYEKEAWEDSQGRDNNEKYIEPTVCRKITEKKIDGIIYKSEIKYELISYDWMVYYKEENNKDDFSIFVENTVFPKEQFLNSDTALIFNQATVRNDLYFNIKNYDKETYSDKSSKYTYLWLTCTQNDDENYKYYQNIFNTGYPKYANENVERSVNSENEIKYFDLIVEEGYAINLLNEFKGNKEEADEIAKRFEKSEIYDKIYNLKY